MLKVDIIFTMIFLVKNTTIIPRNPMSITQKDNSCTQSFHKRYEKMMLDVILLESIDKYILPKICLNKKERKLLCNLHDCIQKFTNEFLFLYTNQDCLLEELKNAERIYIEIAQVCTRKRRSVRRVMRWKRQAGKLYDRLVQLDTTECCKGKFMLQCLIFFLSKNGLKRELLTGMQKAWIQEDKKRFKSMIEHSLYWVFTQGSSRFGFIDDDFDF